MSYNQTEEVTTQMSENSESDDPLPRPEGWSDEDVRKLEAAIAQEVQRQLQEFLGDPLNLATMLVYALKRREDQEQQGERNAS